jgi:pyruvate,water dikinase
LHAALRGTAGGAELETRLAGLGDGAEFLRRWATFLERHGHQARGGMDPAQPRWAEQPGFVLDMLRVYLGFDADSDPLVVRESRLRERERLLSDCLRRLGDPFRRGVLKAVIWASQRGLVQRENVKNEGVRLVAAIRRAVLEAGRRLVLRGVLPAREDVFFLRLEELEPVLCSRPGFNVAAVIGERKAAHARDGALEPPPLIVGKWDPALKPAEPTGPVQGGVGCVLHGVAVSPGVVTGPARVIRQCDGGERLRAGEILVAPYTDPGWTPYFLAAAGVVVDVGGQLSHGSVVAREYGLPAVVNVRTATTLIKTGQRIRVDGTCGVVTVVG